MARVRTTGRRAARDPSRTAAAAPAGGVPEWRAWMTVAMSPATIADDALLGLLLPFWQLVIGVLVLVAVRASVRRCGWPAAAGRG